MNFLYSPNDIAAGMVNKNKAEETPNVFAEMDGAAQVSPSIGLDEKSKQRMAGGPAAARALQLMNDPVEQERTMGWMEAFGMSNQGMEFNQAKTMQLAPTSSAAEQPQEESPSKPEEDVQP